MIDFTVFAELQLADGSFYTVRFITRAGDDAQAAAIATGQIMQRHQYPDRIRLLEVFPTASCSRWRPTGPQPWAVESAEGCA